MTDKQNKIDHQHCNHDHSHEYKNKNPNKLLISALLIFLFMFVELIGGILSNSLALMSDAIHMLTDFVALSMAFFASYVSQKENFNKNKYERMPILIAYTNILILIISTGYIFIQAIERIITPEIVVSFDMIVVAIIGLLINIVVFFILHSGKSDDHDLNMKGALLHVIGDLLGSFAAVIAGIVIMFTGWSIVDPILSIFICFIILHQSYPVFKESIYQLMKR